MAWRICQGSYEAGARDQLYVVFIRTTNCSGTDAVCCVAVEELVNAFLIRTTPPPSLSEAVLDHDYTVQIMKRFAEGAREYWSHTIAGVKKMEMVVLEPMRAFMQGELRNFKASLSSTGRLSRYRTYWVLSLKLW